MTRQRSKDALSRTSKGSRLLDAPADDFESGRHHTSEFGHSGLCGRCGGQKRLQRYSNGTLAECMASFLEEQPAQYGARGRKR